MFDFISASLLGLSLLSASSVPTEQPEPSCITIVGTNDVHGVLEPHVIASKQDSAHVGGVMGLSGYLDILRKKYPKRLLWVDAGDIFQGTLPSNLSQGKALIGAYRRMGLNAAAVGNHEFDYGPLTPDDTDKTTVLQSRMAEAKFAFVSSNIFLQRNHQAPHWKNLAPSTMLTIDGHKIGIIGASTPSTPQTTRPQYVADLEFPNPAPFILAESVRLRAQGAQLIVLTAHMGGHCNDVTHSTDISSCDMTDDEMLTLINTLPAGTVDVAVAGHTHQFIAHWVRSTMVIESGARAQHLGYVEACFDAAGKFDTGLSVVHQPVEMCLEVFKDTNDCKPRSTPGKVKRAKFLDEVVEPNKHVVQLLTPYIQNALTISARELPIDLPYALELESPDNEHNLGFYVAESLKHAANAEIGIQNRGGVRIPLDAGSVSYGEIYQVLPFENQIVRIQLTGEQLAQFVVDLTKQGTRPLPYLSGLTVERKGAQVLFLYEHKPLDLKRIYTIGTNDFLVAGGDATRGGLPSANDMHLTYGTQTMRDALIDELSKRFSTASTP